MLHQLKHKGTNRLYGINGLMEGLNVHIIKEEFITSSLYIDIYKFLLITYLHLWVR